MPFGDSSILQKQLLGSVASMAGQMRKGIFAAIPHRVYPSQHYCAGATMGAYTIQNISHARM